MSSRIYTQVVTVGDIEIYHVSGNPTGVLQARIGSLAISNTVPVQTWQNVDGANGWFELNNTLNRPYLNSARIESDPNIYVGDWSSLGGTPGLPDDITGTGTINLPYATAERAIQDIGESNPATKTIWFAPGVFDLPGNCTYLNWINFQGHVTDAAVATQSGAAIQADDNAIIIDVTGLTTTAADELRGTLIQWTSGSPNGRYGWIYHNDITGAHGPGITRLQVTQNDQNTVRIPAAGNQLKLLTLDTTLRLTAFFNLFQASVQCNFRDLVMSDSGGGGTFVAFPLNTDKIGWTNIFSEINRIQVGRYGGLELLNCYCAHVGHVERGLIAVTRGADLQFLRGTVIDADLRATDDARRFIEISNGALMSYEGNSVMLGLNAKGLLCDGSGIGCQGTLVPHDSFAFHSCDAGFVINAATNGAGGWYQLPNLFGVVASSYAVTATDCACVLLGPNSNIQAATGINAVSADNGINPVAQCTCGTVIFNGAPAALGFATPYHLDFDNTDLVAGVLTVGHGIGRQYVTVQVYDNNDDSAGPFPVKATGPFNCDIDLTAVAPIVGTWHLVIIT